MGAAPFLAHFWAACPSAVFRSLPLRFIPAVHLDGDASCRFYFNLDEAIPVILAQHDKAWLVLWLLLTKVTLATIAGYAVDLVLKEMLRRTAFPARSRSPEGGLRYCDCHAHGLEILDGKLFFSFR